MAATEVDKKNGGTNSKVQTGKTEVQGSEKNPEVNEGGLGPQSAGPELRAHTPETQKRSPPR